MCVSCTGSSLQTLHEGPVAMSGFNRQMATHSSHERVAMCNVHVCIWKTLSAHFLFFFTFYCHHTTVMQDGFYRHELNLCVETMVKLLLYFCYLCTAEARLQLPNRPPSLNQRKTGSSWVPSSEIWWMPFMTLLVFFFSVDIADTPISAHLTETTQGP